MCDRVVHTDDTGWRVGGEGAFLMAFETDETTVYQVRARHRNEEVREVVLSEYGGSALPCFLLSPTPMGVIFGVRSVAARDQPFAALIPTNRIGLTLWRLTRGRYHWEVAAGGAPSQAR